MKKAISLVLCLSLLAACAFSAAAEPDYSEPSVSAACAVVIEPTSGRVLFAKNADKRASMASTTKIMTALLLCENCDLQSTATVTAEMVAVEGTSMGLQAGDTVHYRDLLYGMLLASGNDAANAAAILIAGSLKDFARLMNARAKQLGMSSTNFVTPSGLDDENHYTTAADMAKLAAAAMCNSAFAEAAGSTSAQLEYGSPPYKRTLTNHNKLLRLYDGCNGVKTGFTKKSGRCLVSSAERGGKRVIAVTLNAPDDWNDHKYLLDFGFSQLSDREFLPPKLPKLRVAGGTNKRVPLTSESVTLHMAQADLDRIQTQLELPPCVFAPVKKGEKVGCVRYLLGGKTAAEVEITAASDMPSETYVSEKGAAFWFKKIIISK